MDNVSALDAALARIIGTPGGTSAGQETTDPNNVVNLAPRQSFADLLSGFMTTATTSQDQPNYVPPAATAPASTAPASTAPAASTPVAATPAPSTPASSTPAAPAAADPYAGFSTSQKQYITNLINAGQMDAAAGASNMIRQQLGQPVVNAPPTMPKL